MKKILVIGYVWPEPNSSAAGSHMMSVLRLLKKQNWQIQFATPAQETDHMTDLNAEGITSKKIKCKTCTDGKFRFFSESFGSICSMQPIEGK